MKRFEKVDYKKLINGLNTTRSELSKFSIVYIGGLQYTSGDKRIWETDLNNHLMNSNEDIQTYFYNSGNGRLRLALNSLEELLEISRYFGEFKHLFDIPVPMCSLKTNRVWIYPNEEFDKDYSSYTGGYILYIYIYGKKDYFKFREKLLNLHKIGYLVTYNLTGSWELYIKDNFINILA